MSMYSVPPPGMPGGLTMRARLRPMGIGDILDETFRLYRENFALFIAIVMLILVPLIVIVGLVAVGAVVLLQPLAGLLTAPSNTLTPAQQTSAAVALAVIVPIFVLLVIAAFILMAAALAVAISNRYLDRPVTVGSAYRASLRRLGPLLLATIWAVVRFALLITAVVLIIIGLSAIHLTPLGVLVGIGSIPLFTYLGISWWLLPQVVVLETVGGIAASKRSRQLISGYWWKAFGLYLVVLILVNILSGIPAPIVGAVVGAVAGPTVGSIANGITSLIVTVLVQPIQMIATTLLFYDLKIRKEAFDLEALVQQAGLSAPMSPYSPPSQY